MFIVPLPWTFIKLIFNWIINQLYFHWFIFPPGTIPQTTPSPTIPEVYLGRDLRSLQRYGTVPTRSKVTEACSEPVGPCSARDNHVLHHVTKYGCHVVFTLPSHGAVTELERVRIYELEMPPSILDYHCVWMNKSKSIISFRWCFGLGNWSWFSDLISVLFRFFSKASSVSLNRFCRTTVWSHLTWS